MQLFRLLLSLQALLALAFATDNGLTKLVTWDNGSLLVNGERIIIMAGEFHYQRLPVPELWLDVFQKFKANGMNTVSIYFFWSYHSASRGAHDFTTPGKDIQAMFDMAKKAGLYVIARPGPYCNAETNAGGFALWTSDGRGGKYRTSDETYHQAWSEWIAEVGVILKKNQITEGGPIILVQLENELQETTYSATNTLVLYMEQLKTAFREAGLIVPTTHNEKGFRSKSWSTDYMNVGGAVNIYGLDSYPGGLSCTNPNSGFNLPRTYYQWFHEVSPTQPELLPEFEGGWFQPWGGYFYDQCQAEHSPEFADVYYKGVVAQRVTLLSLYMAFGGTSWGHSAAPVVYTSYDYAAPLSETRQVTDKFKQFKLLALFTRVSQGLQNTVMESNGSGNAVDKPTIWTWVLKARDSPGRFYLAENNSTGSRAITDFTMTVNTSAGTISIPNMQLNGRQSRWVVTDYPLGKATTLLYSSAEVLTYGSFDSPVVVFYLKEGQAGEFAFKSSNNLKLETFGADSEVTSSTVAGAARHTKVSYKQAKGATVVRFSNGVLAYLLDVPTAWTFYAPPTVGDPNVKADQQVFVVGPYLVRSASVSGRTVSIVGDNANATTIEVYVGSTRVDQISWNGKAIATEKTKYGSLTGKIPGATDGTIALPTLNDFKTADSLPELSPSYNDKNWKVADKNTTLAVKPATLPVLYSSDYAFYTGAKLYRAYFSGIAARSLSITVQGGLAAGWNAWLNGQLIGGSPGNASLSATTVLLSFRNVTLKEKDNVVTVVTDYNGHDQTSTGPAGSENPRGIIAATLLSSNGTTLPIKSWKIQGNAGGEDNIDPVRGPMNEGGLYGERLGWHLPGFDTRSWKSGNPTEGIAKSGIQWYTSNFDLHVDEDLDVPVGIELGAPAGTVARVLLFVNGYQFGKFLPHIGPQTRFPIPPGIINMRGSNTLSIALWAQTDAGAKLSTLRFFEYARYQSGFPFGEINGKRLQPGWKDRSQYA
ncbi:glycoside hydrolase family 35 protein [Amniculicola lignicola CBS 123094]|uniref:beta-galactosidase n=1 Tax=Amniculicola lignicola CBS 123094 TaxID=1392246 RepID=A0A6A5WIK7_9PLEO|nr:glycoside hydrolase family 35 protein [Amniculicola lignicola CBS 123094]